MFKCPKCKLFYVTQHIVYNYGTTGDTYYTCLCGYDSRDNIVYSDNHTESTGIKGFSYSVKTTGSELENSNDLRMTTTEVNYIYDRTTGESR